MAIVKYLLPSAPCKITLPNGIIVNAPDGIIAVDTERSDQDLLAYEMQGMLAVGNCSLYREGDAVLAKQIPPTIDLKLGINT